MFDIIGKRFRFFLISGGIIFIGIISLLTFGLKTGIEFSSGSMLTVDFEQEVEQGELEMALADIGHANVIIQRTGAGDYLIRTVELNAEDKEALETGLEARFGQLTEPEFSSVSPLIATETVRTAVIAVAVQQHGTRVQ